MMGVANRSKVIVRWGSKLQALCQDTNWGLVTVAECISADGGSISPLIAFKAVAQYYGWHPEGNEESTGYLFGYPERGCTSRSLLYGWLKDSFGLQSAQNLAYPQVEIIIWDGHEPHLDIDVIEIMESCQTHCIQLLKLSSNIAHLFQPLNLVVFSIYQHNILWKSTKPLDQGLGNTISFSFFTLREKSLR